MWMGADGGALMSDRRFAGADVVATSYALAQGITKLGPFDLVLCGKQTTDGDTAQVGPEVAEFLGIPHVSYVTKAEAEPAARRITAWADLGETEQIVRVPLPCLLTVDKEVGTPRLPSFVRSPQVRGGDIAILSLDDLPDRAEKNYGLMGSPTQVERIFPPHQNTGRELVEGNADEVARRAYAILLKGKYL